MNCSLFLNRTFVIAAVVAPAACILWFQHQSTTRLRNENSALKSLVQVANEDLEARSRKTAPPPSPLAVRRADSPGRLSTPFAKESTRTETAEKEAAASGNSDIPYVSFNKAGLKSLSLKPLSDSFQVTDEAAAVLGLSADERASVNQAVARVIAKHEQLDLQNVKQIEEHLSAEEGRKTSFKVAAYPEQGKLMAQEAAASVHQSLGAARADLLFHYADLGSLSAEGFEPFGRTEKTITFIDRENPDGTRGDCRIQMRVVDTATGLTLTTGFQNRDDTIPQNWRHLIQNLSPEQGKQ